MRFRTGGSYTIFSIPLLKNFAICMMRLLYENLANQGRVPRLRYFKISREASAACRKAAVTPLAVMGSTIDAASPAISQFGPATPPKARERKEVTLGSSSRAARSNSSDPCRAWCLRWIQ